MDALPAQVLPLFKHLLYPRWPADEYGGGLEYGLLRGNPAGRIIIDVGLNDCKFLAWAVNRGYVVHGFEPRPAATTECARKLPNGRFRHVAVSAVDGLPRIVGVAPRPEMPPPPATTTVRESGNNRRNNSSGLHHRKLPMTGFAYLYTAAAGSAAAYATMGVNGPYSSLVDRSYALRPGMAKRRVPIVRLDEALRGAEGDVWLLKIDAQGYEDHVLAGAAALFTQRVVAHAIVEYTPSMLRDAGVEPVRLVQRLKSYGMLCFDTGGPEAPWSLSRDRPSLADDHAAALERNTRLERSKRRPDFWQKAGAFDDLLCVNVAHPWTRTPRPADNAEGWAPFSRCGEGRVKPRCGDG